MAPQVTSAVLRADYLGASSPLVALAEGGALREATGLVRGADREACALDHGLEPTA